MNPSPRSPSRDRVDRYKPRQIGEGQLLQPRRYFRDHPLEWWKTRIALALAGVAVAILSVKVLVPGVKSDYAFTHGPVASVHAAWDNNCEACHNPQSPTSSGVLGFFNPKERWLDLTCQKCHAGPAHHTSAKWPSGWPNESTDAQCAACHHDHGGRSNSLVRLTDTHCVTCHANLAEYHKAGASTYAMNIRNFSDGASGGHPNMKKLEAEKKTPHERGLKFSHLHHMSAGIQYVANGRGAMTKKDLAELTKDDPAAVGRYFSKEAADSALVQLRCDSCHQLDSGRSFNDGKSAVLASLEGEPKESINPPRAEGAYYLPINFEAHCQSCHPLKSPGVTTDAGQQLPAFDLPHRKQPKEMAEVLKARIAGYVLTVDKTVLERPVADKSTLTVGKQIEAATAKVLGKLFSDTNPRVPNAVTGSTCLECHKKSGDERLAPTSIPTVWFEHSKFNHVSHRGVSCLDCHPNTQPTDTLKFDVAKLYTGPDQKINIQGVDSCRACHAPSGGGVDSAGKTVGLGGVRHACTDCHRYHNGEHPFQGRGAAARDPAQPYSSTLDFLTGKPAGKTGSPSNDGGR